MFHPSPSRYAALLPGYGPTRVMLDGAYSSEFHAGGELLFALAWATVLGAAVWSVLRRRLAVPRAQVVPYGGMAKGAIG